MVKFFHYIFFNKVCITCVKSIVWRNWNKLNNIARTTLNPWNFRGYLSQHATKTCTCCTSVWPPRFGEGIGECLVASFFNFCDISMTLRTASKKACETLDIWVIDQVWGQDGGILAKFFFVCLWTEESRSINSQKRTRPISIHLDETNLVNIINIEI